MNFWRLMLSAIAAVLLSIAYLPLLNKTNSTTSSFFSSNYSFSLSILSFLWLKKKKNWFFSILFLDFFNLSRRKNVLQLADFIVTNATIFTADDSLPFAESMAIRDTRIVGVGNYSFIKVLWQFFFLQLKDDTDCVVLFI